MIILYIILAGYLLFCVLVKWATQPVEEKKKTSVPVRKGGGKKSAKSNISKETKGGNNTPKKAANTKRTKSTERKPPRRKNVSQTIPNGRTLQTRDEYIGVGNKKYRKPGYGKKGLYRKVVVIDSNRNDEVAVVKLTTSKKGKTIEDYKSGNSKFKPFVETKDSDGNPIKIGRRFKVNSPSADVPMSEVVKIKKLSFVDSSNAANNSEAVQEMKGRKKTRGIKPRVPNRP